MRTARGVLLAIALLLLSCAAQQQEQAEAPPPPPAHPSMEGNFRAVSRADISRGLAIVRRQMVKQHGETFPIYSVYVVDQNHMSIRYWVSLTFEFHWVLFDGRIRPKFCVAFALKT
jgi:hypothetical protein